jgi:peptide/nickel transport system permease protein
MTSVIESGTPIGTAAVSVHRRLSRATSGFASSEILRVILRRIGAAIPVLWGVTFLTFCLMNLLPGDAAQQLLGANATPAQVERLATKLHLNEPFLTRYWHWLTGVLTGNFGHSLLSGQPVTTIFAQRLPVTIELAVYAFVLSIGFAIPVALVAARRRGRTLDHLITVVTTTGFAIPSFVLALLLIIVFAVSLELLPATGFVPITTDFARNLRYMTMPAVSLGFALFCLYTRLLRGDIVDQLLGQDYVMTARAKGASQWRILVRHVLRNSVFGLITVVALNIGALAGGTVIIEQIFGLPGMGSELLLAINNRDVTTVEATVLLVAIVVVLANLAADLLYAVLDPRVRYGRSAV